MSETAPLDDAANLKPVDAPQEPVKPKPSKPRPKRPVYARIHAKPLPLEVFPLPAFVPHNPLSLIRILAAVFSDFFSKQSSRPADKYIGYFSHETRSVHVTDPKHARALWEMGFFGKGTLSRSEPSWLDRETARRKAQAGGTSEEHTSERRQERRMFKLERARAEREMIEEQLRKEGKLVEIKSEAEANGHANGSFANGSAAGTGSEQQISGQSKSTVVQIDAPEILADDEDDELAEDAPLINQEHLQLCLAEAFFLSYGLGVLSIVPSPNTYTSDAVAPPTWTPTELLSLFAAHATFPPCSPADIRPDSAFFTSYVAYHHYRSLGWVIRPGAKFAADWILYNRGPVFSHAEFTVVIIPEYPPEWEDVWGHGSKREQKKWWDVHCINRVTSQVRKTLILCYVEVPLRADFAGGDVATILKSYKVRDLVLKRWLANRSRD